MSRKLNDNVLGLFKALPPSETLNHLVRYLSTWSGSDKLFMIIQYGAKLLVAILQLRRFRHSKLPVSLIAVNLKKIDAIVGNSRMLWRIWGLLPILQWLGSMEQTQPPSRKLLTIERLQGWSMLAYYPLEHIYYLASQKIIPMSNRKLLKIAVWSCRFWAAYVVLQFVHLREDWRHLRARERALKGTEITPEQKEEISRRKRALSNEFWANVGYFPLTIHWSLEQGLYRNEGLTGLFGLIAGFASFRGGWEATA